MQADTEICEAGRYPDFQSAAEHALVVLAGGGACWLFEEHGEFLLFVEADDLPHVSAELEKYDAEQSIEDVPAPAGEKSPIASLFVYGWLMLAAFIVQARRGQAWTEAGALVPQKVIGEGEWWRCFTALTLHGDLEHLAGNILCGILFVHGLLALCCAGLAWSLFAASGFLGNWMNAWIAASGPPRSSIGASTAVFGALGALALWRMVDAAQSGEKSGLKRLLVPLGAGVALLGWLGAGSGNVDIMAHLCGFVAGGVLAVGARMVRLKDLLDRKLQLALAFSVPIAFIAAWWFALR